jgi:hypothetical protein
VRQQALVVPDKLTRVANFHRNTLEALRELVQAAGLQHPRQISASHIVRRTGDQDVRLLSSLLLTVAPGELLAAERGEAPWPHPVFSVYWPQARADSFAPTDPRSDARAGNMPQRETAPA